MPTIKSKYVGEWYINVHNPQIGLGISNIGLSLEVTVIAEVLGVATVDYMPNIKWQRKGTTREESGKALLFGSTISPPIDPDFSFTCILLERELLTTRGA